MPGDRRLGVLLIDDLPEMRRLVELWLEDTDVRVVGQAGGCEDAFGLIERQRPHVVVMDMNMPGADGIACTAEVLARNPQVVVVGFSSSDDPRARDEMCAAGASAYFHKSGLQELVAYLTSPELRRLVSERRAG